MKIQIELKAGSTNADPKKIDIDKNIWAVKKALKFVSIADFTSLMDTISILEGIKTQLE